MSEELSLAERAVIERNRQKALIRLEKKRRYANLNDKEIICNGKSYVDLNAGFLIDKEIESKKVKSFYSTKSNLSDNFTESVCSICSETFFESFLKKNFDLIVCNKCRDPEQHKLINKTSAKEIYLLNDIDLNKRQPNLKFIVKPNPKNSSWGDMKLYLEAQRSLEIWGSEEALETERKTRLENIDKMKIMKYQKSIKKQRENAKEKEMKFDYRGHQHVYLDKVEYDAAQDLYRRTCGQCGYVDSYEELD